MFSCNCLLVKTMREALKDGLQCTEGPVRVLAVRQSFVKEEHLEGCMRLTRTKQNYRGDGSTCTYIHI